ncbi:MAG TPA: ATP phosphoribosyltransferase regulatory subunit [Methyloceanibacter sp.]|jgi:ATP phosphoribosyltransferase regulatory subunit|nr:ATP phosphoribosyltransferase regulatory subunit [Methyloceanibacter sp.]
MAAESVRKFEALEAQAAILLDVFKRGGFEQVAPSIIQPADIFLDQIGEAIRGRTYVFTDLTGEELCLRPDLTVPVSRLYLERHPRADVEARYCYNGPAFRFQQKGASQTHPREFRQAGIECFGVADRDNADAEVVLLVADAVRSAGLKQFRFRFGDIALFFALLDALSLPERWRLKLRHYFWRPPAFHTLLSRLAKGEAPDSDGPVAEFAATLAAQTPSRAEELVANYLETNDLPLSGNRTMSEITERLLDHAADLRAEPLPREVATVIDYYLAVEASPREAIDRIALIGQGAGIDLGPALYVLYRRFDLLEERGINVDAASFATEFGRDLEYYSGLVFQIEVTGDKTSPIAGGGRYDGLLRSVGARAEVPAVGSAIHTERLLAAVKGLS